MENQPNETNSEAVDIVNGSPESPEIRHENAENSDSSAPHSETSPPATSQEETSEESEKNEDANVEEPSPLEGRVAELEQRLEQSETQRREGEEKLSASQKSLKEAISRYRTMLLESMPEAPEPMVVGETVDEVDRSFADARALVERVRREVEEKLSKERLPAGSPTRGSANFATLTPMEKIRSALTNP